jgi:hypothetical protein
MTASFPATALSHASLDQLFQAEVAAFRRGFEEQPVPLIQDLRAGTVAWIAVFAPEAISAEARLSLRLTCEAERDFADYASHGWYRTVYLHVAQYALSHDESWLTILVTNLDHSSSQLRSSLHAPLGLVAPHLKLSFPELRTRIESSLSRWYMYNESLLCILLVLDASPTLKLAQLLRWREQLNMSPQDIGVVDKLKEGMPLSNALIAEECFEIVRYMLCRLLELSDGALGDRTSAGRQDARAITFNAFWQRMAKHPLMSPIVYLKASLPASEVQ